MTAIAILGTIFLPAMLVAVRAISIPSPRPFHLCIYVIYTLTRILVHVQHVNVDFSPSTSTGSVTIPSNFWMFWAVTIPLTLAVLVVDEVRGKVDFRGRVEERGRDECVEGYSNASSRVQQSLVSQEWVFQT